MTESGKQKLRLFSIALLVVSMIFWLEGQGAPGWKAGMAILLMAILTATDSYLAKGTVFRIPFAVFCLFFLFFAVKNFLAR